MNIISNNPSNASAPTTGLARQTALCIAVCMSVVGCNSSSGFRSAGTTQPPATIQHVSLARLQERQGDAVAAREMYEAILESQPNQPLVHHRLGVLDAKKGEYTSAIAHFEIARSAGKPSAELLNDLGYAFYLKGDLGEAERWLKEAISRDSRNLSAHNNLGLVLGAAGRDGEALTEFRLAGSMADAYNNIAWVHSQRGNIHDARQNYLKALDTDDSLKPAAEALVALGNHEQAMNRIAQRDRSDAPEPTSNSVQLASHATHIDPRPPAPASTQTTNDAAHAAVRPAIHETPLVESAEPGRLRTPFEPESDMLIAATPPGKSPPAEVIPTKPPARPIQSLVRRFDNSKTADRQTDTSGNRPVANFEPEPTKPHTAPAPKHQPAVETAAFWTGVPSAATNRPDMPVIEPAPGTHEVEPAKSNALPPQKSSTDPTLIDWPAFK